jgi:1-pyrroline-5-carboxylate dehydrogenase
MSTVKPLRRKLRIDAIDTNLKHSRFSLLSVFSPLVQGQLPLVLKHLNRMQSHLTAGIVSNDMMFINHCLGETVPGTTYVGIRAKTTAAPQQHWFGPSGDPRSGGIHTPEAIKLCWSSHREVIYDHGPVAPDHPMTQT